MIREKEARQKVLQNEIEKVEDFIEELPEGIEKQVLEMVYLDGENQYGTADALGITRDVYHKLLKNM